MTATWWLRSRGRYGLARAARAPVADSHSLSSFAILLAIFLKPIDVPEIRLNRTPFRESRGSLHTSISHCTWLSVAASPCAHSRRNRSRCSYWHLLASRTWKTNGTIKWLCFPCWERASFSDRCTRHVDFDHFREEYVHNWKHIPNFRKCASNKSNITFIYSRGYTQ